MSVESGRNRQMPTFFVIGAAKCGTTSLHAYLDLHPDISMSSLKEPQYFAPEAEGREEKIILDRDEYLSLFAPGTLHRGEASVRYSECGSVPGVPEAISREIVDPKFIYLVRDPIERLRSTAQEASATVYPRMSWRPGPERHPGTVLTGLLGPVDHPAHPLTGPGRYMTQIRAYLEYFPAESILVVDADRLRSERSQTMNEVFSFLGVEHFSDASGMAVELNRGDTKARASRLYSRFALVPAIRKFVERLPHVTRTRLALGVRRAGGKSVPKPDVDPLIRRELEELFRPEVEELRAFTGQSFSGWSI